MTPKTNKNSFFTNCNQNRLIFHKRVVKVRTKKKFGGTLWKETTVEKHWLRQIHSNFGFSILEFDKNLTTRQSNRRILLLKSLN
jgi:hypothetical protein